MAKRLTIKDHSIEIKLFNRRIVAAVALVFILAGLLIFRLVTLQVEQHKRYTTLSDKNKLTILPIAPTRGLIYDRKGRLIAENTTTYNLELMPRQIKNLSETIERLKELVRIDENDLKLFKKAFKQRYRYDTVPLRTHLTPDEIARFYVNQHLFPGIVVQAHFARNYPYADKLVDVLGYVGRINERELTQVDPRNYLATNYIGKLGVEKYYEETLHGRIGYQQVETDASGRIVRILQRMPPVPGDDLYLSLDIDLQIAAQKALGEQKGAAVAIDPNNGEVLAMISQPTYDPNPFVHGISTADYKKLRNDPQQPLYSRALRGQYSPGSTIKPFLALQGLRTGTITPRYSISDPGYFRIPGVRHTYHDWKRGGHGRVSVAKAIIISCDTFFYTLAYRMGIRNIAKIMNQFGFGAKTGIDLSEELPGIIPTAEWKKAARGETWYRGDSVLSGIGQGYVLVTPLQLATGVAGIAMHGKFFHPHFLKSQKDFKGEITEFDPKPFAEITIDEDYWNLVTNAMYRVITSGTGRRFGRTPYHVAGKTGTAQLVSQQKKRGIKQHHLAEHLRDNTLFIAFAPVDQPKIAVGVVIENGKTAPQVARKIMDSYLLEKKVEDEKLPKQ